MKKFYFLAMMAMAALTTTSCQKDDFNDAPVKTATVVSNNTSSTTSTSTTSSTSNSSTVYYKVEVNSVAGTMAGDTSVSNLALNALRDYYKYLLGSDVTPGATCGGSYFRLRGEANENGVTNKIQNTSVTDLDNALAKVVKLYTVNITVYDKNNNVLFGHKYTANYDQAVSGTWTANLNNTAYTLKVTMEKPDKNAPFEYKATLKVGEKTYEGTFGTYTGSVDFESQDKTLNLHGKFSTDFKTFDVTVKANNESLGTATFSKQ